MKLIRKDDENNYLFKWTMIDNNKMLVLAEIMNADYSKVLYEATIVLSDEYEHVGGVKARRSPNKHGGMLTDERNQHFYDMCVGEVQREYEYLVTDADCDFPLYVTIDNELQGEAPDIY